MDCKKIGRYIKIKRMRVGLTQNELGEKLGITGKAVSKWECGIALPDIGLFDELSKILQIEMSELLTGEDNKEKEIDYKNRRLIYRLSVFIFALLILIVFLGNFFINNYNKVHVYDLVSAHNDFYVEGKLISIGNESYLSISDVSFVSRSYNNISYVSDFNYQVYNGNEIIYKYSFSDLNKNTLNYFISKIYIFTNKAQSEQIYLKLELNYIDENNKAKKYVIPLEIKK